MDRPVVNYDVMLQYAGATFPLAEALARGREDFLRDQRTGLTSVNPYTHEALRGAWIQGYEIERIEFAHVVVGVR